MSDWNSNNRACTTTWTTLRVLGQISKRRTFNTTGPLKMTELTFWASTGSGQARTTAAKTLSIQMHNVFTMLRGASLESGITQAKAIETMVGVLKDKDKTVADLAEMNDASYLFWRESDEG